MRFGSILAISLACASAASAEVSVTLNLGSEDMTMHTQGYTCDAAQPFDVQYLTSDSDALALVPVDGVRRIFVNVVSASGARYVSGQYEWWTKGETATLGDVMQDDALLHCTADNP
ncbi:MliC family protein [Ponticoccus sp. (in: a-proteobacteria)]|uniref:MliC family protein n=1 Tax=Ponticoccus sp. (in: a-proteobacteria) TaxID=1925025 RepID=UPI003AB2EDBE